MDRKITALLVLAAAGGCKSPQTGAKEEFSKDVNCPADRVEVRPRADLTASAVLWSKPAAPPPKVAADPERLAMFNKKQQERAAATDGSCEVFEAKGCDTQVLYCCSYASQRRGNGAGQISCSKGTYPEGAARW